MDGSLLWSPYLQFACSVELCEPLLCLPILQIQCPALPTPTTKWFMVGIGSGEEDFPAALAFVENKFVKMHDEDLANVDRDSVEKHMLILN